MRPEIAARIDADMATTPAMTFRQVVSFLAGYSARFDAEIRQGQVTRSAVQRYADEALHRVQNPEEETA